MPLRRRYYKRRYKRSRFIRRTYGSRRRTSRIARMSRRYQKPELKWTNNYNNHVLNAAFVQSFNINPISIGPGTGQSNRIGNRLKFLRFRYHLEFRAENIGSYTLPYQRVRVIMWTPRIADALATAHVEGLGDTMFPDPNQVCVYKDTSFNLYQISHSGTNVEPTQSDYQMKQYSGAFPFPRNVVLTSASANISNDFKDIISVTVTTFNSGGPQVQFMYRTRTTYVDT